MKSYPSSSTRSLILSSETRLTCCANKTTMRPATRSPRTISSSPNSSRVISTSLDLEQPGDNFGCLDGNTSRLQRRRRIAHEMKSVAMKGLDAVAKRNSQDLWMRNLSNYAATSFSFASDRSTITPLSNTTPARTRATSSGALTARHLV